MELSYVTAAAIGFLGSTHCVGMCGGIVSALNAGIGEDQRRTGLAIASYHLTYNAGRVLSYVAAGAGVGIIGAQTHRLELANALPIGGMIAALFMIALGLYVGGWWRAIAALEIAGGYVWRRIEPFGRRFLPVNSPTKAFGLGLIWGWLPCGLVYSALALALLSGSPQGGAAIMLGFGIGTLPMLLIIGKAAQHLGGLARHRRLRQAAGVMIILFGVLTGLATHNHQQASPGHAALDSGTHSYVEAAISLVLGEICWTPSHRGN
jgi:uncharacterized protein